MSKPHVIQLRHQHITINWWVFFEFFWINTRPAIFLPLHYNAFICLPVSSLFCKRIITRRKCVVSENIKLTSNEKFCLLCSPTTHQCLLESHSSIMVWCACLLIVRSMFKPWLGTLYCSLGQDTRLLQCLSPCIWCRSKWNSG